ncbi:MAG TPA: hypothetical protein VLR46_12325, partial [Candidatus Dormibacteraeota bacterium]|nr:hypothetical protein [Candidatus Dormibacteraeota bacterium]
MAGPIVSPATATRPLTLAAARPANLRAARLVVEGLLVVALPVIAFMLLRIRLMPFPDLNDPAMHTTFIVDPHDIFERYSDLFTPTARLREGARVGLLVPARISYLLFGPVGGFVVFRYMLAVLAVGTAYLLLRRLAGVAAGLTAALVVMTCPVIITAWGTDFPDSASVSYLIGALACLAMPSLEHRVRWGAAAVVLLTLAAWAFAASAVIGGCFAAVYFALRWWREREHLRRDVAIAVGVSLATTVILVIASGLLLGQFDFILPTVASLIYLAHPSQEALWHSSSWAWAPYETYLLVLPVIALAWLATAAGRIKSLSTPHLMIGAGFTVAVLAAAAMQFIGRMQLLEEHYFSSLSWAAAMLTFGLVLAVVGRPLLEHRVWRWSVPAMVVAVALAYEFSPRFATIPSSGGVLALAAVALLLVVAADRVPIGLAHSLQRPTVLVLLGGFTAGILMITVAPIVPHGAIPGVVPSPVPQFSSALGGSDR